MQSLIIFSNTSQAHYADLFGEHEYMGLCKFVYMHIIQVKHYTATLTDYIYSVSMA